MDRPRFSVVVPTRERAGTLRHSLRTCLEQDFDDYEIVVSDNCSSPATRQVVDGCGSSRVRYVRSDRPLAMSDSWELAVGAARGEYVTVLGDDDGLMPYALRELDRLIRRHGSLAVHWCRGLYTWPDMAIPDDANLLRIPLDRWARERDGREQIAAAARYEIGADLLPMIYNAVIHRSLIDRHRELAGRVFPNLYPDVYSGFAFAYLAGTYLSVGVPMNVAGLSGNSNGVSFLQVKGPNPIAAEFVRLHDEAGFRPHPTVPPLTLMPVHVADCFQYAKDHLFPADGGLVLDRRAFTVRLLASIPSADPAERDEIRATIRTSLADRPDLLSWFDNEAPELPPCPEFRMRGGTPLGYDGRDLSLDAAALGIRTIHDAVRFADRLLGVGTGPVRYDLPSRHELALEAQARLERAEAERLLEWEARTAAEHRANLAERDGSLRYVPRRAARKVIGLLSPRPGQEGQAPHPGARSG